MSTTPTCPARESADTQTMSVHQQTAFWNIPVGGVGIQASRCIEKRYRNDREPFAMAALHIDTDPATRIDGQDRVLIQLTGSDVRAMRANPATFGETTAAIIRDLARMLDASDILNGSRTTRALTQLAFNFHLEYLCRAMRNSLIRLLQRFKVKMVTPVILSSSAGGTGSAAQILLMDLFRQQAFRHRLLSGLSSDHLGPPMSFVCEPFAYVNETSQMQARKIMANALAFRVESEFMLQQRAASYVTHIGYANAGGTVLADPDLMAKVLGNAVYEIERCWPELKARWVDGPDDVASMAIYPGQDSPLFDLVDDHWIIRRKST